MSTETRFTYVGWDNSSVHDTPAQKHLGLVYSRQEPWSIEDLVSLISRHETSREFLRSEKHPYFIIPCPPTEGADLRTHNLFRQPISSNHYNYQDSPKSFAKSADNGGDGVVWIPFVGQEGSFTRHHSLATLHNREQGVLTSDTRVAADSPEWRYIVTPILECALSQELHTSSLHYSFSIVSHGTITAFSYSDFWKLCPIVQGVFQGYAGCPKCDLRGYKCVKKWFLEVLEERTRLKEDDLQVFAPAYNRGRDAVGVPYVLSYDWDAGLKDYLKKVPKAVLGGGDPVDQSMLPGVSRVSRNDTVLYVSRGKCRLPGSPIILSRDEYTPAHTSLLPEDIALNTADYQRNAEKSAATKNARTKTCGVGASACVLRDQGCERWRGGSCETRWESLEHMLHAGVESMKKELTYTEFDFSVAFDSAGMGFWGVNPETGCTVFMTYAGLTVSSGALVHRIVRESNGQVETLCEGSWRAMREFVREWAPQFERRFWYTEQDARNVTVSDEAKVMYAECASLSHMWSQSAFMGYCPLDIVSIAVAGKRPAYTGSNTAITLDTVYGHTYYFSDPIALKHELKWSWFKYIPA